ncbi:MAG: TVP38/TMEM64 family protein [Candidatus Nomurabacteria bacterium]|jgi:uncharacterized membrane protein YdjX (TVP38/TMEM64 family)|nr:TVP38/TMEM64 family protein [Candidatus Nomurabacteria bacterium]
MKLFRKNRNNWLIIAIALVIIAAISALFVFSDELLGLFDKTDALKEFILSAGVFAPALFMLLQLLQIIVAPIPGQVIVTLGGLVFGWWGFVLSMLSAAIGYYLVFIIARRFGRPLAERLFDKKLIKKFDYVTKSDSAFLLFIIFLLPFFPDDIICYLAGMTKTPIKYLMIAAILGRIPSFLAANLVGIGIGNNNLPLTAILTGASLVLGVVCWWQRKNLEKLVKKIKK